MGSIEVQSHTICQSSVPNWIVNIFLVRKFNPSVSVSAPNTFQSLIVLKQILEILLYTYHY